MTVLVTGSAGFIGYHLSEKLLKNGYDIIGLDNINDYYNPKLKQDRLGNLEKFKDKYTHIKCSLEDSEKIAEIFNKYRPKKVVNLAAQAGVRYSIENPRAYIDSNIVGFCNILEACRNHAIDHLVYASSSSVYGGNTQLPFSESNGVDHPVSLYAATKKSNELMAHVYSHLYGIPSSGLRFFTVYGPWGRPDMALFKFTKSILEGKPIEIYNNGNMVRDFTYIDDIVEGIIRVLKKPPTKDESFDTNSPNLGKSWAPYRIFNIGNSNPTQLMQYIEALEDALNLKAKKIYLPMQPGDVPATSSDTEALELWVNFKPSTSIKDGIYSFVQWYKDYHHMVNK